MLTPGEKSLRGRLAAHAKWAKEPDATAATAAAREAFLSRFETQVDPENKLTPQERTRRAEHARKAYFLRLAMRSAKARRAKSANRRVLETAAEMQAMVDEITGDAA